MNPLSGALVERLTRREQAILVRLAEDKSDREIAALETLALSSVKWYARQIYAKLGVTRRSEAVERARELGLLQLAPASIPKNNLPAQLTSFIGRQKEIGELRLLLRKKNTRLITLTGTGGTGKTRLALQVAGERLDDFSNGVWLVDLAPLADPALVPQTVIAALGQVEQSDKTPIQQLADYLREKQLLLILDNCEHLVDACAELAAALLHGSPRLTILASSREILGVEGEFPYRVPPLRTPDLRKSPPLEELARFEAVQLFVERAQVVSPEFALNVDNAPFVAQITQRLDGIPLAIELAAARLRQLSAGQIVERLSDAFRLLTGGSRTALPRHQTLTALIDWSYNLLSEAERGMLRSLSTFAGGWTLEAAEQVCGEGPDVLDLLRGLADKSLIQVTSTPSGEMRYRMLETVRQYAHARLVEAGEAEMVRARHLAYYLRQAERLEPKFRSREQIATLDYWESELDNLRLALEWALQEDIEAELRLAAALQWFWHIHYHWVEGISWLERGLEVEALSRSGLSQDRLPSADARALMRAKALTALGFQIMIRDKDIGKAKVLLEEAIEIYRASVTDVRQGLAWALVWLGWDRGMKGNLVQGRLLIDEALTLFRETGESHGIAEGLHVLGEWEIDPERAKKFFLEQLALDQANGDIDGIATALMMIGVSDFFVCNYESACKSFEASREHFRQVGNLDSVNNNVRGLAYAAFYQGNLERAAQLLDEVWLSYLEFADDFMVAWCLWLKSMIAFAQGRYDQVVEFNDKAFRIAQKTSNPLFFTLVSYIRARLAHINGDAFLARQHAEEGLNVRVESGFELISLLVELSHVVLQDGDLERAGTLCRESLQVLINNQAIGEMGWVLDGFAALAVREGKLERAARLFGTRLWRGIANALSPIERAWREADFVEITAALGKERFAALREEGYGMSFMQVMALAQEEG